MISIDRVSSSVFGINVTLFAPVICVDVEPIALTSPTVVPIRTVSDVQLLTCGSARRDLLRNGTAAKTSEQSRRKGDGEEERGDGHENDRGVHPAKGSVGHRVTTQTRRRIHHAGRH